MSTETTTAAAKPSLLSRILALIVVLQTNIHKGIEEAEAAVKKEYDELTGHPEVTDEQKTLLVAAAANATAQAVNPGTQGSQQASQVVAAAQPAPPLPAGETAAGAPARETAAGETAAAGAAAGEAAPPAEAAGTGSAAPENSAADAGKAS